MQPCRLPTTRGKPDDLHCITPDTVCVYACDCTLVRSIWLQSKPQRLYENTIIVIVVSVYGSPEYILPFLFSSPFE